MNIILIGPQGSGKGTQAKLLSEKYNIPHISTGNMLRAEIEKGTPLGERIKSINEGQLVPDPVIIDVIKERIKSPDCKQGFILDGFPRTIPQAKALDKVVSIDYVIALEIPDQLAVDRLSNRRQCKKCNFIYGLNKQPKGNKCDCGGELYIRKDDYPEAIRKRLELYHNQTEPILSHYTKKKALFRIDGSKTVDDVLDDISAILN